MKKKIKLSLAKAIIKSDFFIINKINFLLKNKNFKLQYKNKMLFSLNIQALCLELKQLVRMFRYHFSVSTKKSKFLFSLQDELHQSLMQKFIKDYPLYDVVLTRDITILDKIDAKSVIFLHNTVNFAKIKQKLIKERVLLTGIFSPDSKSLIQSFYVVKNTIDRNKKLLFLLSLLEMSVKNYND